MGTLSPASWAIHGASLPPHHAGTNATKLPSRHFSIGISILDMIRSRCGSGFHRHTISLTQIEFFFRVFARWGVAWCGHLRNPLP